MYLFFLSLHSSVPNGDFFFKIDECFHNCEVTQILVTSFPLCTNICVNLLRNEINGKIYNNLQLYDHHRLISCSLQYKGFL